MLDLHSAPQSATTDPERTATQACGHAEMSFPAWRFTVSLLHQADLRVAATTSTSPSGPRQRNKLGSYYCWSRIYDPKPGRFTSPDPAASPPHNLFDYARSLPVANSDPTGLLPRDVAGVIRKQTALCSLMNALVGSCEDCVGCNGCTRENCIALAISLATFLTEEVERIKIEHGGPCKHGWFGNNWKELGHGDSNDPTCGQWTGYLDDSLTEWIAGNHTECKVRVRRAHANFKVDDALDADWPQKLLDVGAHAWLEVSLCSGREVTCSDNEDSYVILDPWSDGYIDAEKADSPWYRSDIVNYADSPAQRTRNEAENKKWAERRKAQDRALEEPPRPPTPIPGEPGHK